MKKHLLTLSILLLFKTVVSAAVDSDSSFTETEIVLQTPTGQIFGTLTTPHEADKVPVALLLAGSGPTDRNGNNPLGVKTDAYKQLAHALAEHHIACLRFDKRGIAASWKAGASNEAGLRFEDYINDAAGWIALLRNDKRFSSVIVVGHSEGSLIGMVAAKKANKFVSVAGAGESADKILKTQLAQNLKTLSDSASQVIDSLKAGKTVSRFNIQLFALFRPSIQPYLISWFKYDPQEEIKKLKIPILVIQGTTDLQIPVDDAKRLKAAQPKAQLVLINHMNHALKKAPDNREENLKTYNNPALPIDGELVASLAGFINGK